MTSENLKPDIYIQWNMLRECNFSCDYCIVNATHGIVREIDIPRVVQRFDKLNKTLLIYLTGGEPFLIPNFTELVQELTKKHFIILSTNLSVVNACKKFLNTIDPGKVLEIVFSLHILERKKRGDDLNELVQLVKMFQEKGFKITGNYVAHPSFIGRIEKDIGFFGSHGIRILPEFFWGTYNGKQYPVNKGRISYSKKDFELITKFNPDAKTQLYNIRNSFCQAGSAGFAINHNYEVFMCNLIPKKLGDFYGEWHVFQKVIRCINKYCNCPLNGGGAGAAAAVDKAAKGVLHRAISEKGTYSLFKSYRMITGQTMLAGFFNRMPAVYKQARIRLWYSVILPVALFPRNRFRRLYQLLKGHRA